MPRTVACDARDVRDWLDRFIWLFGLSGSSGLTKQTT